MSTRRHAKRGFTLIELLVVIAIIGILAGFIAVGLPRAIEAAKIASLENSFLQLRTALTEYYVDHNSYPPAYGYIDRDAKQAIRETNNWTEDQFRANITEDVANTLPSINVQLVYTTPYLHLLGQYNNRDLYDNFSIGYDTNQDGQIGRLEFFPIVTPDAGTTNTFSFSDQVYTLDNLAGQVNRQLNTDERRPIVYIPVNKRQARQFADALAEDANSDNNRDDPRPFSATSTNAINELQSMSFPPPRYDAYVLLSVGPGGHTGGLPYYFGLPGINENDFASIYYYHVLGMLTYYMATRDSENAGRGDGELDFDFRGRVRGSQSGDDRYLLPDGSARPGPIIFEGEA